MYHLRDYQDQAIRALLSAYDEGTRRMLFTMPTGTGKTVVFARLLANLREQGLTPALVLAHRSELLLQARDKLLQTAPDLRVGIEQADSRAPEDSDVICASVQTLIRPARLQDWNPKVQIVDEAHHASADNKSYADVIDRFGGLDGGLVIGCTATPARLDKKALHTAKGALFERVVFEYSLKKAIKEGYLVPLRGYRVQTEVDLSEVHTMAGDFSQEELARLVDQSVRTGAVIDKWREVAGDRPTLAFCVDVAHSQHVADAFNAAGICAESVHGGMAKADRDAVRRRFEGGETQVVANCQLWTEGVDIPPVACILMLRPTKSWSLYCQMVGRGTRLMVDSLPADTSARRQSISESKKPDCIIIDVVDNCGRHKLTTLPAMLMLPADLDLEGTSLEEAADMLEDLGERSAGLVIHPPKTVKDIRVLLEEIDLLHEVQTPAEIEGVSQYSWLKMLNGYMLQDFEKRELRLTQDALSNWILTIKDPVADRIGTWRQAEDETLEDMIRFADRQFEAHCAENTYLLRRDARFRKDPPSEKQIFTLRKMGVAPEVIAAMNKGQAMAMLTKLFARRK